MDDCALSEVTTLSRPCRSYAAEFDQRPCPYELIRFIALVLVPRLGPKLRSTDTSITVECVAIAIGRTGAARGAGNTAHGSGVGVGVGVAACAAVGAVIDIISGKARAAGAYFSTNRRRDTLTPNDRGKGSTSKCRSAS